MVNCPNYFKLVMMIPHEAFAMVMSFFCKEPTAQFGIEYGYDLLNLISVYVLESTLTKVFQD